MEKGIPGGEMKASLSAIILAAGSSSRMGSPKALLPLGGKTVLERIIRTYGLAGVSDIRVVTGYDREKIQPVLERIAAREVYNPAHQDGMYSSVRCGVASCGPEIFGYFIHPVDIPLVEVGTIRLLCESASPAGDRIPCPDYKGQRGHPPLIGAFFRTAITKKNRPSGLKGLLYEYSYAIVPVIVDDPGVLMNMNTPADYEEILKQDRASHE
jgi:molybdenum cofactor cytidylyltransferase